MSKLIVSVFTERYNYPFYAWTCFCIVICHYYEHPNSQYNKSVVFKLRGLSTPKCRSPPFLFSKEKQRTGKGG